MSLKKVLILTGLLLVGAALLAACGGNQAVFAGYPEQNYQIS